MQAVEAAYPGVKVFSLPSMGAGRQRIHVELGVRGEPAQVQGGDGRAEARSAATRAFPYK